MKITIELSIKDLNIALRELKNSAMITEMVIDSYPDRPDHQKFLKKEMKEMLAVVAILESAL